MATKKPVKESTSRAVANWDEELARQAKLSAGMEESTATGQFFGLKGGILTFNDSPIPGNQMAVIILDAVLENVYFEGKYDPDVPQTPMCFAFGRDEKTMAPHKIVVEATNQQCGASGLCNGCDMNEFGTAEVGKGKACRNTRRLAMIPAGTLESGKFKAFTEEEHFASASLAFMKLPVTSVKGYAGFVKQVTGALKRPPHSIFTKVSVVPDPKSQFKVVFEPLTTIPNDLMETIIKRHEEAKAAIEFPYMPFEENEAPPPKRGAATRGKPNGKAARRKY